MKEVQIYFAPYELQSLGPLNKLAVPGAKQVGALLQVGDGYADLHPWPELGDAPLQEQLGLLRDKGRSALIDRALAVANADAEARQQDKSLFKDLEIPQSHYSIADLFADSSLVQKELERAAALGYQKVKAKTGGDPRQAASRLKQNMSAVRAPFKLRLDMNSVWSCTEVEIFLKSLGEDLLDAIDFIEDPCAFDAAEWLKLSQQFNINLALDRGLSDEAMRTESFSVCVVKPALSSVLEIADLAADHIERVVVTSYMDHPLGQAAAAWQAACLAAKHPLLVDECGLITQHLFAPTAYSKALRTEGPKFLAPEGSGLGFDDLLKKEKWQRLH